MKELKFSTKKGKELCERGARCTFTDLSQIYTKWSVYKENAYYYCLDMYLKDKDSSYFGIGNANTFGFTASWYCKINDENVMRIETKDNSYIVWLER